MFYRRARAVLKTELNYANRIEAIDTLAVPVVTYSFNIINWTLTDIKKLDTKVCKLITTFSRNLVKYCCKCCILIGYANRYLFVDI